MNYWVLKAKPSGYDYEEELQPGAEDDWENVPAESVQNVGDRVFLWASSPARRVAGLGVVIKPTRGCLRVRYLTDQLGDMPTIERLKSIPILRGATFLLPRHGTAFPLTHEQAKAIYRVVTTLNPWIHPWSDWPKAPDIDDIEADAVEGNRNLVTHLRRERNPQLARKKKAEVLQRTGKLSCEACSSDYPEYSPLKGDIFEVHHRRPLSDSTEPVKTLLKDLAVLCPNCHRAIHRTNPMLSVGALARRLKRNAGYKTGKRPTMIVADMKNRKVED